MNDILATMAVFSGKLSEILGSNLVSVVLFGSAVLGDFRAGEGDLDFMAATRDGLTAADCGAIFELHDCMRSGAMGQLSAQLEGTYYPLPIIQDPQNATANGCYIGTSRKGWKSINQNRNSMADYAIMRQHGIICYGEDIRDRIYCPSRQILLDEIHRNLDSNIEAASGRNDPAYAIAMFHWAPRALCYAMTGELVSKRKAAEWYASVFADKHWTSLVTHAKQFRHYPLSPDELAQLSPLVVSEVQGFLRHICKLLAHEQCPESS